MNLLAATNANVGEVNPYTPATVQISIGYSTDASGKRVSQYAAAAPVRAQVQALTQRDLRQLDGLNLNGTQNAIYLYGTMNGTVRLTQKGGDLITINGDVWLTSMVLEQWNDWVKVAAVLQNGS